MLGAAGNGKTRVDAHGELSIVAIQQTTTRAGDASAPGSATPAASSSARGDAGASAPPAAVTSRTASGHLVLVASGVNVFASGPPVDVSLDLPLSDGDPNVPLSVTGLLSFAGTDPTGAATKAAATAPVSGTLDLSGATTKLELSGKTGAIPCVKAAAVPGTPAGPAAPAREGTNGIVAMIAVTLDDLPGARVLFQPTSACTPRLR